MNIVTIHHCVQRGIIILNYYAALKDSQQRGESVHIQVRMFCPHDFFHIIDENKREV